MKTEYNWKLSDTYEELEWALKLQVEYIKFGFNSRVTAKLINGQIVYSILILEELRPLDSYFRYVIITGEMK